MCPRCTNYAKYFYVILAIAIIATVSAIVPPYFMECPLTDKYEGNGDPSYKVEAYSDKLIQLGTTVEAKIPEKRITELLAATSVKKGSGFNSLPSPCFELTIMYSNDDDYLLVIGKNGAISVTPYSDFDNRTYWVDSSGNLFDELYKIWLENGGETFE